MSDLGLSPPATSPELYRESCATQIHGSQATLIILQAHLHAALVLQGLRFDAIIGCARARRGWCVARERGELARDFGDGGVVVGLRCDSRL